MFIRSDHPQKRRESDETELWEAFRQGETGALSELFRRYYSQLYRYGMKLLGEEEGVKDGIQQLFLKLWNKRGEISEAESVEFYLLKSLRRILFRQKERVGWRNRRNREYLRSFPVEPKMTIEDKIVSEEQDAERQALFEEAFLSLTDRQKEVLYLRLQHGLKNKEIAHVMGITHQRVRNYISEATNRLKNEVKPA